MSSSVHRRTSPVGLMPVRAVRKSRKGGLDLLVRPGARPWVTKCQRLAILSARGSARPHRSARAIAKLSNRITITVPREAPKTGGEGGAWPDEALVMVGGEIVRELVGPARSRRRTEVAGDL